MHISRAHCNHVGYNYNMTYRVTQFDRRNYDDLD
jgi:hypothetical protein